MTDIQWQSGEVAIDSARQFGHAMQISHEMINDNV